MSRVIIISTVVAVMAVLAVACGGQETGPTGRSTVVPTTQTPAVSTPEATLIATPIPTPAPTTLPTASSVSSSNEEIAAGQAVFTSSGCVACHTIQRVPGAVGQIGPELTDIATNAATRKPGLTAEEYIRESIENPTVFVVDGFAPIMPSLRGAMGDDEFESLVAFLMNRN